MTLSTKIEVFTDFTLVRSGPFIHALLGFLVYLTNQLANQQFGLTDRLSLDGFLNDTITDHQLTERWLAS